MRSRRSISRSTRMTACASSVSRGGERGGRRSRPRGVWPQRGPPGGPPGPPARWCPDAHRFGVESMRTSDLYLTGLEVAHHLACGKGRFRPVGPGTRRSGRFTGSTAPSRKCASPRTVTSYLVFKIETRMVYVYFHPVDIHISWHR